MVEKTDCRLETRNWRNSLSPKRELTTHGMLWLYTLTVCLWELVDREIWNQTQRYTGTKICSVRHVFLQVAIWRTPLPVLATVSLSLPAGFLLAACAVRASQVGQALGRRPPFLAVVCRTATAAATVMPLCAEVVDVVPQVLQVESPGAELLPIHSLEGHDAVQVSPHLCARKQFALSSNQVKLECHGMF